jgi:hypothetical protein
MVPPRFFMLLGLLIHFYPSAANHPSDEMTIVWSDEVLDWHDFRALPDRLHGGAMTASGLYYNFRCIDGQAEWVVRAVFFPNKSFVNPEVRHPYMLAHEQLHFDITELFARRLRRQLAAASISCDDRDEVDYLCERAVEEWRIYQEQYDEETQHSLNRDAQVFWNRQIANELKALEVWRD